MMEYGNSYLVKICREQWNKGQLIGQHPQLQPKHVWSIRIQLHLAGKICDLALFNLAIGSMFRGFDIVALGFGLGSFVCVQWMPVSITEYRSSIDSNDRFGSQSEVFGSLNLRPLCPRKQT